MLLNLKKKEIRFCLYDFEKYFYFLKILKMANCLSVTAVSTTTKACLMVSLLGT